MTTTMIATKEAKAATIELLNKLEANLSAGIIYKGSVARIRIANIKVCELWSKKGEHSEIHMEAGSGFAQLIESYFPGREVADLGRFKLNNVMSISYKEFDVLYAICEMLAADYEAAAEKARAEKEKAEAEKEARKKARAKKKAEKAEAEKAKAEKEKVVEKEEAEKAQA